MRKIKLDGVDHFRLQDASDQLMYGRNALRGVLNDNPQFTRRTVGRVVYVPYSQYSELKELVGKKKEEYILSCRERMKKVNEQKWAPETDSSAGGEEKEDQARQDMDLELTNSSRLDGIERRLQNIEALLVEISKVWK